MHLRQLDKSRLSGRDHSDQQEQASNGDFELCATVHNQLMNYCKQWIEMEWKSNGIRKRWMTYKLGWTRTWKLEKNEAG
jgi:biotin-(acetyl-CoA carboxylase) ligase